MGRQNKTLRTGRCHCGSVVFSIEFYDDIGALNRCNCSLCRKRGAIMASIPIEDFHLTAGAEQLILYEWNTHTAKHYFCGTCGIYTHHRRRSRPEHYAINVACLDGPNVAAGKTVGTFDGASNSLVAQPAQRD